MGEEGENKIRREEMRRERVKEEEGEYVWGR